MMEIIISSRFAQAAFMLMTFVFLLYALKMSQKKKEPFGPMRNIEAMNYLEEAVGRASEMGSHVVFWPGGASLFSGEGLKTLAGISIMGKVAEICARLDVPILTSARHPDVVNLSQAIIQQSFEREGALDKFDPDWAMYWSNDLFSYSQAVYRHIIKEKPATAFLIGYFGGTAVYFGEPGANIGAFQIGAPEAFFALCCNYFMIGEELYAAGAWASEDDEMLATIASEDLSKIVILLLMGIGVILSYLGNTSILQFLSW